MEMKTSIVKNSERVEVSVENGKLILINRKLLEFIPEGDYELEDALLAKEASNRLAATADEDYVVLIDFSKAGKSSAEARQIWNEMGDEDKKRKIALTGLGAVAKVIASFAIAFTRNKNMRFFTTRKEALKWLEIEA